MILNRMTAGTIGRSRRREDDDRNDHKHRACMHVDSARVYAGRCGRSILFHHHRHNRRCYKEDAKMSDLTLVCMAIIALCTIAILATTFRR